MRTRIKTNVNNRIYDLIHKIHANDKKRARKRFKMYLLRYEYEEMQVQKTA